MITLSIAQANRQTRSLAGLLMSGLLLVPHTAISAWAYEPFVSGEAQYVDNIRMVSTNPENSAAANIEAGVDLSTEVEATQISVSPKVRSITYFSESELNTLEQSLQADVVHDGERTRMGLSVSFANQSAITTELTDTGNVSTSATSKRVTVAPQWTYRLTPLSSIEIGFIYNDVSWDDENPNLQDYDANEFALGYSRRMSEHSDATFRVSQREFSSPDTNYTSDTANVEVGWTQRFTERTQGNLLLGAWDAEVNNATETETTTGFLAAAGFSHATEVASYGAELSRSVVPSSAGQVREDTRLTLNGAYRIGPSLNWGIAVFLQKSDKVTDISSEEQRDYFSVTPYLEWKISPQLALRGSLGIANQTIDKLPPEADEEADRSVLGMSITYRKPKTIIY